MSVRGWLRRHFHQHRWLPRQAVLMERVQLASGQTHSPFTRVLYVCRDEDCAAHKTVDVPGEFALESFLPIASTDPLVQLIRDAADARRAQQKGAR